MPKTSEILNFLGEKIISDRPILTYFIINFFFKGYHAVMDIHPSESSYPYIAIIFG